MTVLDDHTVPAPPPSLRRRARNRVRNYARNMRISALVWAYRVRDWKLTPALPGVAGMCLVSASAGLAASYGGVTLGLAAGIGVLGAFLLRIDARL